MNATEKRQPSASNGDSEATAGAGDAAPVSSVPDTPRQQADDHLSETAKIRRRCVYWLDSECRGGPECRCLPPVPES